MKKIQNGVTLFSCLLIFYCTSSCSSVNPTNINWNELNSFYILSDIKSEQKKELERNGFIEAFIIYQKHFDSNNDGKFEKDYYLKYLDFFIPSKKKSGLLVLDWEGEISKMLRNNTTQSLSDVIKELIDLIKLTKKVRPNLSVGYYGFPFRIGQKSSADWIKRQSIFLPLFEEVDVIMPSVYDRRPDEFKSKRRLKEDYLHVKNNVEFSLKIGHEVNKPVLPFIWHRYHHKSKRNPMKLIPSQEFKQHICGIRDANFKGKKVSGFVWWGPDKLFYNRRKKQLVEDVAKQKNFDVFFNDVIKEYSTSFKEVFKSEYNRKTIKE